MALSVQDRPTVLLVGSGERMQAALEAALDRHGLLIETASTDEGARAVFAAAPDLVVLLGDAAVDGGRVLLARLGENPATAMVPVLLLADGAGLDARLDAFRHGVVAVVPKSASADGMARRIAELAAELPERSGETTGELGETSVEELVTLFSEQLRSGILSVTAGDGAEAAQVVVRAGRPVTEAIEELVERLRPLIQRSTGSLRYEFHESPAARIALFDDEAEIDAPADLRGRRILVVEQNPARADVLVQELRAQRAQVVVADGEGHGLDRARAHDPEIVILDGSGMEGWALPALRELRRDVRLRWASLLLVDGAQLWVNDGTSPESLARLLRSIPPLVRPDLELVERARREFEFDARLELVGPSRMLRALASTGLGLRASIVHPRARVEIDVAEGLIAGAHVSEPGSGKTIGEGPAALAGLIGLASGRVRIARKDAPASANVMAPVDDALAQAAREKSPLRASVRPVSAAPWATNRPPPAKERTPRDSEQLLARLETLLSKLHEVLPVAERAADASPGPSATIDGATDGPLPPPPRVPSFAAGAPKVPRPEREDPTAPAKVTARALGSPKHEARELPRAVPAPSKTPAEASTTGAKRPGSSAAVVEGHDARANERAGREGGHRPPALPSGSHTLLRAATQAPSDASSSPRADHAPLAASAAIAKAAIATIGGSESSTRDHGEAVPSKTADESRVASPPFEPPEHALRPDSPAEVPPPLPNQAPPPITSADAYATTLAEGSIPPPTMTAEPYATSASGRPPPITSPDAYASTLAEGSAVQPAVEPAPDPASLSSADSGPNARPPDPAAELVLPERTLELQPRRPNAVIAAVGCAVAALFTASAVTIGAWLLRDRTGGELARVPDPRPSQHAPSRVEQPVPVPELARTVDVDPPTEVGSPEPDPVAEAEEAEPEPTREAAPAEPEVAPAEPEVAAEPEATASPDSTEDADEDESDDGELRRLIRTANFQRNRGDLREAELNYQRALRLQPRHPRALAGLTKVHIARRDGRQAVRWARILVAGNPRNAGSHVLLGDALATAGNRTASVRAYQDALQIAPSHRDARRRLGE